MICPHNGTAVLKAWMDLCRAKTAVPFQGQSTHILSGLSIIFFFFFFPTLMGNLRGKFPGIFTGHDPARGSARDLNIYTS